MDLRQLAIVVAVVDEGGFTSAADALEVSQPTVSQAVRALEVELGVELFLRSGRTVRLTAAGEALLEPARQALRDAATARAAVAEVAGLTAGHLDLVCLPTLAVAPTAELIGRFRRAHPGVTVRLAEPDDPEHDRRSAPRRPQRAGHRRAPPRRPRPRRAIRSRPRTSSPCCPRGLWPARRPTSRSPRSPASR